MLLPEGGIAGSISGALPTINGELKLDSEAIPGSINGALPTINGNFSLDSEVVSGSISAPLPTVNGAIRAYINGQISGPLPSVNGSFQQVVEGGIPGLISGALPAVSGNFTLNSTAIPGSIAGALPTVNGSVRSSVSGSINGALPSIDGTFASSGAGVDPVLASWRTLARNLQAGVPAYSTTNKDRVNFPGLVSPYGTTVDGMEGFVRSFIPYSYLAAATGETVINGVDMAAHYKAGILAGTAGGWAGNPGNYDQRQVEVGSLAIALWYSRNQIWNTFTTSQKTQVGNYLRLINGSASDRNNWLFFPIMVNTVMKALGETYSQSQIDDNFNYVLNKLYLGSGWYNDGIATYAVDFYNHFAFHYYSLLWADIDGDSNPTRRDLVKERFRQFMNTAIYMHGSKGNIPAFGRSITYRCGYLSAIALGVKLNCIDIAPGVIKRLFRRNFEYFFGSDYGATIGSVKGGANPYLSLGWRHESVDLTNGLLDLVDPYSSASSPGWMWKAGTMFLLDSTFWNTPEQPLPSEAGDYMIAIPPAGMSACNAGGHVNLLSGATGTKSRTPDNLSNAARYTKQNFSSRHGFNIGQLSSQSGMENALVTLIGTTWQQRGRAEVLYLGKGYVLNRFRVPGGSGKTARARTAVIHKNGDILALTWQRLQGNFTTIQGGFALGYATGEATVNEVTSTYSLVRSADANRCSFIKRLNGFISVLDPVDPYTNESENGNPIDKRSLTPRARIGITNSPATTSYRLATIAASRETPTLTSELDGLVTAFTWDSATETVRVTFADGEKLLVQMGEDPVSLASEVINGVTISGFTVFARVTAGGVADIITLPLERIGRIEFNGTTNTTITSSGTINKGTLTKHPASNADLFQKAGNPNLCGMTGTASAGDKTAIYTLGSASTFTNGETWARLEPSSVGITQSVAIGLSINNTQDTGYWLEWAIESGVNKMYLKKFVNGAPQVLDEQSFSTSPVTNEGAMFVRIKRTGNVIKGIVNGCEWFTYDDSANPLAAGFGGFRGFLAGGAAQSYTSGVLFDEVEVYLPVS